MKPGIETSEFKVAVAVLILVAIGAALTSSPIAEAAGYIGAALTAAGYGFVRATTKKADSESETAIVRERIRVLEEQRIEAKEAKSK